MATPPRGRRRRKKAEEPSDEEKKKREQEKAEAERKEKQRKAGRRVALEGSRTLETMVGGPARSKSPLTKDVAETPSDDGAPFDLELLDGIEVTVPVSKDVTEEQVDARLDQLVRAHSLVRALPDGEPLQMGDEVLMDVMGYVEGDPFLAQNDAWMSVQTNPLLPGLFEQVAQGLTGEHKVVRTILPDDYPDSRHAGKPAGFVLHIKAANRVDRKSLDDKELLEAIDKGDTAEQLREAVRGELTVELAEHLVKLAQKLVLEEVARRTAIEAPRDTVDAELLRMWRIHEGDALTHGGASKAELEAAKQSWFDHPERREEVRHSVWVERLLDAVAKEKGFEANADEVVKIVVQSASAAELPVSDVHTALMSDEDLRAAMAAKLKRQNALEWLLSRASVTFGA